MTIAVIGAAAFWLSGNSIQRSGTVVRSTGEASIGGPFELVDHTGRRVTDTDFKGKWLFVFFGFTYCPDACPLSLHEMAIALDKLGEAGGNITTLFITVDPDRDTPEVLADYVQAFHPRITGLTGSAEQVAAAAKAYRVYYSKSERTNGDAKNYNVDHTTVIYFMGPDGKYLTHFRHDMGGAAMAERMRAYLPRS